MNQLFSNFKHFFVPNKSSYNESPYQQVINKMQAMCQVLPGAEAVLEVDNGEICMRLTWDVGQEKPTKKEEKTETPKTKAPKALSKLESHKEESVKEPPMTKLYHYLQMHYAFRFNRLTEQTECVCLDTVEADVDSSHYRYMPADKRTMNGICINAMNSGINCWDKDIKRYVESDQIEDYHPFQLYFDTLPSWDGTDRVTALAKRVSDDEVWTSSFHRWMLATTAQWMGHGEGKHANSVAPLLISPEQGWGKSTFCRSLLPPELSRYFTESYDLNAPGVAESKLASFGLINMDEFDKLPASKMPLLKNLMQIKALNLRKAYKQSYEPLSRIASFIGTSNRRDLLVDASGSRRFICVELEHPIDCSDIAYEQLYAQLKEELLSGERYWFSKQEEAAIQATNRPYYRSTPEQEVFADCFHPATAGEQGARVMTAAEIFRVMKHHNSAAMRGVTCYALSRLLPSLSQRVHTKYGNGYWVVERE